MKHGLVPFSSYAKITFLDALCIKQISTGLGPGEMKWFITDIFVNYVLSMAL